MLPGAYEQLAKLLNANEKAAAQNIMEQITAAVEEIKSGSFKEQNTAYSSLLAYNNYRGEASATDNTRGARSIILPPPPLKPSELEKPNLTVEDLARLGAIVVASAQSLVPNKVMEELKRAYLSERQQTRQGPPASSGSSATTPETSSGSRGSQGNNQGSSKPSPNPAPSRTPAPTAEPTFSEFELSAASRQFYSAGLRATLAPGQGTNLVFQDSSGAISDLGHYGEIQI